MTSRLKLGLMFINDQSVWPGRSNTSVRPGWDMVAAPRRDGMGKKRARAEHPGNTCGRHRWLDSPADGGANDDVMTDVTGPLKRTAGPVVSGRDRSVRDPCLGAWRLGTKRVEAEARDSRGRSGGTGPARCWGGGARSGRGSKVREGTGGNGGRGAGAGGASPGQGGGAPSGGVRSAALHASSPRRRPLRLCLCLCLLWRGLRWRMEDGVVVDGGRRIKLRSLPGWGEEATVEPALATFCAKGRAGLGRHVGDRTAPSQPRPGRQVLGIGTAQYVLPPS